METKLGEYQIKKEDIASNFEKEKAALEKLKEAEIIAQKAKLETDGDRSTTQLTAAKKRWQDAKTKLKEIDSSTLIFSQANQYLPEYDLQIKSIDNRIAAMARNRQLARTKTVRRNSVVKRNPVKRNRKPISSDPCAINNKSSNCLF